MPRGSLVQGHAVTTSETDAYTAPSQIVKALIQKAQFVNTGVAAVGIDVWITPDGTTPTSDALKVIDSSNFQVGVGETVVAIELVGEYVNTGGKIIVQGDAVGVHVWINGNTFKTEV